jgi:IS5 family transposase
MHRSSGQWDLGQAWLSPKLGRNVRLERIAEVFDWNAVEGLVSGVYAARSGRPSWPPLMLVKSLLLQQWYGLSDPGLEEALGDRLSFRRFVGLGLDEGSPDHSTLSRFRKALRDRGLDQGLFQEIERQLGSRGLLVKSGTLMDATLVEAAVKKPGSPAGAKSPTDPDADWTRKGGKTYFGYKAHVAVDEGSG